MKDPYPTLGRVVDTTDQRCSYSPDNADTATCPDKASWHICWDTTGDNGMACKRHMAEAQTQFVYLDRHPIGMECGEDGARWFFEEKRCGHLPADKKRAAQAAEEPARTVTARP